MIPVLGYTEDPSQFPAHSVDMRPVDTPALRRQYRRLFGARRAVYIGRGANNGHHRLSGVPGRQDIIVRRCLFPVKALGDRIEREYRVLGYLSGVDYPHAPRPIRRIDPAEIDGAPAFAMTYIDGENHSFTVCDFRELGRAVRRLHDLPLPTWMVQEAPTINPQPIVLGMWAKWPAKFAAVQETMARADREHLAAILHALPGRLQKLDWSDGATALLHGDLGDHNFLRSRADGALVLIDWEFAAVSHPLLDLMWLFQQPGFDQAERHAFLEGYGALPNLWRRQLPLLCVLCIVEGAIWAQSGIQDMLLGCNLDYFAPEDRALFCSLVKRIHTVDI